MPRPTAEVLGMIISDLIFRITGFGPSKAICDPFAQKVIEQADEVGYELRLDLP